MHRQIAAAFVLALGWGVCDAATARQPVVDRGRLADKPRPTHPRLADVNDTDGKEPGDAPLNARERQKACAAQWRGFSAAEKSAQGPKWPQFYNRCIKRLKALKS